MSLISIPLKQIDRVSTSNYNKDHFDESVIKELTKTCSKDRSKFLDPILVKEYRKVGEISYYEVVDGKHRWKAYKNVHDKEVAVPCVINNESSPKELFIISYKKNNTRTKDNMYEKLKSSHTMYMCGFSLEEISEIKGLDIKTIEKHILVFHFLKESLREEILGYGKKRKTSTLELNLCRNYLINFREKDQEKIYQSVMTYPCGERKEFLTDKAVRYEKKGRYLERKVRDIKINNPLDTWSEVRSKIEPMLTPSFKYIEKVNDEVKIKKNIFSLKEIQVLRDELNEFNHTET